MLATLFASVHDVAALMALWATDIPLWSNNERALWHTPECFFFCSLITRMFFVLHTMRVVWRTNQPTNRVGLCHCKQTLARSSKQPLHFITVVTLASSNCQLWPHCFSLNLIDDTYLQSRFSIWSCLCANLVARSNFEFAQNNSVPI